MTIDLAQPQNDLVAAYEIQGARSHACERLGSGAGSSAAFAAMAIKRVFKGILDREGNGPAVTLASK